MAISNVRFDAMTNSIGDVGGVFNYEQLSNITQKDMPKALEMMSKLYIEGKMTTQVMQKMFTARHFMEASELLLQINGNMDAFTSSIVKGVSYTQDFYKQMFSLNNQVELLKNNLNNIQMKGAGQLGTSITGLLMETNKNLANLGKSGKEIAGLTTDVLNLGVSFTLGASAVAMFVKYVAPLGALMITPLGLAVGALTGALYLLGNSFYKAQKNIADFNTAIGSNLLAEKQLAKQVDLNITTRQKLIDLNIEWAKGQREVSSTALEASNMLATMVSKNTELANVLEKMSKYTKFNEKEEIVVPFRLEINLDDFSKFNLGKSGKWDEIDLGEGKKAMSMGIKDFESYAKKSLEESKKAINDSLDQTLKNITSKEKVYLDPLNLVVDLLIDKDQVIHKSEKEIEAIKKALPKIIPNQRELLTKGFSGDKLDEELARSLMSKEELDLTGKEYKKALSFHLNTIETIRKNYDQKELTNLTEKQNFMLAKLKEYYDAEKEMMSARNQMYTDNQLAISALQGMSSNAMLYIFEKSGEFNGKKEMEGFFSIYKQGIDETAEYMKGNFEKNLEDQKASYEKFVKEKAEIDKSIEANPQDESLKKRQQQLEENLKLEQDGMRKSRESIAEQNNLLEINNRLTSEEVIAKYKGVKYNNETVGIMMNILKIKGEIAILEQDEIQNANLLSVARNTVEWEEKKLRFVDEQAKAKERATNYQLRYNNYLKENLSVEMQMEQLFKAQNAQHLIAYNYKLKELEANKDLAKHEVSFAKGSLKDAGFSGANKLNTVAEVQAEINKIYAKYGRNVHGEAGKEVSSQFESLKILAQALSKKEKLELEIDLAPLKELDERIKNYPNLMKDAFSSLQGIDKNPLNEFNIQYVNSLEGIVNSQIETLKYSYEKYDSALKEMTGKFTSEAFFEGLNKSNIDEYIKLLQVEVDKSKAQAKSIKEKQEIGKALSKEELEILKNDMLINDALKDTIDLKAKINDKDKENLALQIAILDNYNKMGTLLSSWGSIIDSRQLKGIGDSLSGFGDYSKGITENPFNWSDMFEEGSFDKDKFAKVFGQAMEQGLKGLNMGKAISEGVGSVLGYKGQRQVNSTAMGSLAGMGAGLGGDQWLSGATGGLLSQSQAGMAIGIAGSIVGGLFGGKDKSAKRQAEADRYSREQKKLYDKNTEALNKLAQNMANLLGGVGTLNSTLISSFSKIPTIGKLGRTQGALESMFDTMNKNRAFENVSYQTEHSKTKKKKGFAGIGGSSSTTTWTETHTMTPEQLLREWGYKGSMDDMTTDEMREFSKWLGDYEKGSNNNFNILASAIEDYADALDKFERNIENFFYDATMESFSGISSLAQEELRQQIEDFYKNLGMTIDDELSAEIDKLAEQMSVMVTIMGDVRGQFLATWRDSGQQAGQAFVSSMSPYIEAMLDNMSQIFFDVYFSDAVDVLEAEFKNMAEELVELKRQGEDMEWDSVADSMADSFGNVLDAIMLAKEETAQFNDVLIELQKQALEAGLSLSEVAEIGLLTNTQRGLVDSFKGALLSDSSQGAYEEMGSFVGDMVGNALATKMLDTLDYGLLEFANNIDEVLSGAMDFDSLVGLASQSLALSMQASDSQKRLEAIQDMFSLKDITYENQSDTVNYSSGQSTSLVQNFFLSSNLEAGNVIESDSVERLTDVMLDQIIEKLKVDKGIDITKNY